MFSFRISSIKRTISSKVKGGKRYPKLSDNQVFTVDESKYKTAIVSHQCCPPRLVLPVGGRVGGGEEGGGEVGCQSKPADFETYKQKFTNTEVFLNFKRINSLYYE